MHVHTRSRHVSKGWADALWNQGEKFGTIGAHKVDAASGEPRVYEITTFARAEAYTDESRKPHVVFADDIAAERSRSRFHGEHDGTRVDRR